MQYIPERTTEDETTQHCSVSAIVIGKRSVGVNVGSSGQEDNSEGSRVRTVYKCGIRWGDEIVLDTIRQCM